MILVPISLGELIDKITILKIKLLKITDPKKISNVQKEYDLLYSILLKQNLHTVECSSGSNGDEHLSLHDEQNIYFKKLYDINLKFWEYHDWQREKWRNLNNNDNIIDIELYKQNKHEHILNDERAEIKKQINILFKSDIVEEKQFISYNI